MCIWPRLTGPRHSVDLRANKQQADEKLMTWVGLKKIKSSILLLSLRHLRHEILRSGQLTVDTAVERSCCGQSQDSYCSTHKTEILFENQKPERSRRYEAEKCKCMEMKMRKLSSEVQGAGLQRRANAHRFGSSRIWILPPTSSLWTLVFPGWFLPFSWFLLGMYP